MRLAGRTVPYRVLSNTGRLAAVLVFGLATSASAAPDFLGGAALVGLVILGVALTVGWEVARYRRFSYELTDDTVDIRSGVLSRREREIPYERIQNVDIAQNVLQRVLDLAEVRLETAGGGGTEAQLQYVTTAEADRLQGELSRRKRSGAGADAGTGASGTDSGADADGDDTRGGTTAPERSGRGDAPEPLFALSRREHAVLGLVSADLRLLGLASVVLSTIAPRLAESFGPQFDLVSLFGPGVALLGILGFWALSGLLQVFRYYGFRLTRRADELRYERGLLQRFSGTIPLSKVQTVTVRENVLARALGYASLVIGTAGYAPGQDSQVESAVPIAERDRAFALARAVEPVGELNFRRPPKRARLRYAARYALVVLTVTGLARLGRVFTDLLALWYVPLVGLAGVPLAAHLTWTHRGYHADGEHVVTRNGFWRRETTIVPYDRVQTVISTQTVFQRRRDLGTVTVDTASGGGLGGGDALAVDIDAADADRLREEVADRLQGTLARETGGGDGGGRPTSAGNWSADGAPG